MLEIIVLVDLQNKNQVDIINQNIYGLNSTRLTNLLY